MQEEKELSPPAPLRKILDRSLIAKAQVTIIRLITANLITTGK